MSFTLSLQKAVDVVKEDGERIVRGTVIGVCSRTILATPVGNPDLWVTYDKSKGNYVDFLSVRNVPDDYRPGSLRGAWKCTLKSPDLTVTEGVTDAVGDETISKMQMVAGSISFGDEFYMVNALPYAHRVEYGWSTQAPQGMLRLAVSDTQKAIDELPTSS